MVQLCALTCFLICATVLPFTTGSTDFPMIFNITYDIKSMNVADILAKATEIQSAADILLQNATITYDNLAGYGINASSLQRLNETYQEILALVAKIPAVNATYQVVLSEIENTNKQLNTVIDELQCFQNATACHPARGPCYDAPCKNGAICVPAGSQYTCVCTQGFTGATCETFACGAQEIAVSQTGGQLKSLNFPNMTSGYNCTWSLQASQMYIVVLTINSISTTTRPAGQIYFDVVDIWPAKRQIFNTSTSISNQIVNSTQSRMDVTFMTGKSLTDGSPGSFEISYQAAFFNACAAYDCANGGECTQNGYVPECKCSSCFTGAKCDVPIPSPCELFGNACGPNGSCVYDNITCSNPRCECHPQYTGPFCTIFSPCSGVCGNYSCNVTVGNTAQCNCPDACWFTNLNKQCAPIDECSMSPCDLAGHGDCVQSIVSGRCTGTCVCRDEYTGALCNQPPG